MLKYARIIDEETKEVQIGAGCSDEYYVEIGMTLLDVEQAYNGNWYIVGYTPVKPEQTEEEIKQAKIAELKQKLTDTDYKTSKYVDGNYTEEEWQEIVNQRNTWRKEINDLEQLLLEKGENDDNRRTDESISSTI